MRLSSIYFLAITAVGVLGRHEHPSRHVRGDTFGFPCGNYGGTGGMKSVGYFGNWVRANSCTSVIAKKAFS